MTKKHPPPSAVARARTLRHEMTDAERQVWRVLRSGALADFHFRRQVPVGPFIADFACHSAKLIIEIDGGQHDPESPQEIGRTRFLTAEGYRVIRFWNNDVLANPEGIYVLISECLAPEVTPT